jgi:multidrug resistance efflux pump
MSARLIQVIETHLLCLGEGTEGDPIRRVTQYWSIEGELLAKVDPQDDPKYQAAVERAETAEAEVRRLDREVKTLDATCKHLAAVVENTKTAGIRIIGAIKAVLPNLDRVAKRSDTVGEAVAQLRAAVTAGGQDIDRARLVSLFK